MKTTYNITLGLDDASQTHMNLTAEGFAGVQRDALAFDTIEEAQAAFADIDAQTLVREGFKGYHCVTVWLSSDTITADDEIDHKIIAQKNITVDTTEDV